MLPLGSSAGVDEKLDRPHIAVPNCRAEKSGLVLPIMAWLSEVQSTEI